MFGSLAMLGPIGATELIVILVLALIIFGPGKLPDVGKAIGRSIREFKRATNALEDEVTGVQKETRATTEEKKVQDEVSS